MTIFGCPLSQAYGKMKPKATKTTQPEPISSDNHTIMNENINDRTPPRDSKINDENYKYIMKSIKELEEKYESTLSEMKQKLQKKEKELTQLKQKTIEPFSNECRDTKLDELLLFIGIGLFFIILFDCMYKFGKRSF